MEFRIVIDTREQEPYAFSCPTERRKLEAGDYSVVGHEHRVAVERKSLTDFVHTVIHDAQRFAAELRKLTAMEMACVVVEADLDDVMRGLAADKLRSVSPQSVLGAALHIAVLHRIPVYWCGSRQTACAFTDGFLRMFIRGARRPEPPLSDGLCGARLPAPSPRFPPSGAVAEPMAGAGASPGAAAMALVGGAA